MAKEENQEAFERILIANLARVIDFLKFAEAKNAALLTFSSAWILASISILTSDKELPEGYREVLLIGVPLFVIAAVMAILSFSPKTKLSAFNKAADCPKNYLFFGDIAFIDVATFKKQIRTRYLPAVGQTVTDDYISDLMIQIVVNSQIVARKMQLFNWGSQFVLAAIAVLLVPAAFWLVCWLNNLF